MILGPHRNRTVRALIHEAFQRKCNVLWIKRVCFFSGQIQECQSVENPVVGIELIGTILRVKRVDTGFLCGITRRKVDVNFRDLTDFSDSIFAHGGRRAKRRAIIGKNGLIPAGICRSLYQQHKVGPPVAGNDGIGARADDLLHIGREVFHFAQRVQLIAGDRNRGRLYGKLANRCGCNRLTVGIVLAENIDAIDVTLGDNPVRDRFHFIPA